VDSSTDAIVTNIEFMKYVSNEAVTHAFW
jgi:hypothetical protein